MRARGLQVQGGAAPPFVTSNAPNAWLSGGFWLRDGGRGWPLSAALNSLAAIWHLH